VDGHPPAADCRRPDPGVHVDDEVDVGQRVRGEESRRRQLVENLIPNAGERDGPDVTVTVGDLTDGLYVADDGPGLPEPGRQTVIETGDTTADGGTGSASPSPKRLSTPTGGRSA
jgi:signal transduction histidine kinase